VHDTGTGDVLGRDMDAREYLLKVELRRDRVQSLEQYPFNIPAVRRLEAIEFRNPVTFIVGDNGTGKSTLLVAIAIAWGFNAEGGSRHLQFRDSRRSF
jgi:predicted ATPase